jgi:hypothetical protein
MTELRRLAREMKPVALVPPSPPAAKPAVAIAPKLARPVPLPTTRDGAISVAGMELQAAERRLVEEPIDWAAVLHYATTHGVGAKGTREAVLARVNALRAQGMLPRWYLAETLGDKGELPGPKVGANFGKPARARF